MMEKNDDANKQKELSMHLRKLMLALLDRNAMTRLNTIKATQPEFATQVEIALFQLFQAGKIKPTITDSQLRQILTQLVPDKKKTTITRR